MSIRKLTADEVRKLAVLARLELSDDEVAQIGPQLDSIFGFVQKLSQLDTTDVAPMTTAMDVDNHWREDVICGGISRQQALANSPQHDEQYFQVPAVLKTT